MTARAGRGLLGIAVFAAALGIWEAWARAHHSFLVPAASTVARAAWSTWPTAAFGRNATASLERFAAGFVIGSAVAVVVGLLMGASRRARRALEPLVEIARAIPAIAIVPVLLVIVGLGNAMRISVIAFGVCFPVLVNTIDGVRAVSPEARDTATMLHVGRARRIFGVYLPAALPSIVAGLRVAVSIGLVMVVISELAAGGGDGLGVYIRSQQTQFNVPEMYGGILFLGLLGLVLNGAFVLAERRLLHWHAR